MAETKNQAIKLRKITIENIKVIDRLELEFPEPRMKGDLDVLVMGSKNGLGKTSVLESCALLLAAVALGKRFEDILIRPEIPLDIFDLLIRSGQEKATIRGVFTLGDEPISVEVSLFRARPGKIGNHSISGRSAAIKGASDLLRGIQDRTEGYEPGARENLLFSLAGLGTDPLLLFPLMYFHSYRKVQEGSPELSMLVERERFAPKFRRWPRSDVPFSAFKVELLRSIMGHARLFENMDAPEHDDSVQKLNELLKRYAGGELSKLRPLGDNTIDFRISTGPDGPTFSFDGLSSGQKEIISTLYLIWRHTRDRPGIVLIDEPELHLNHEWHRDFVRQLHNLAPDNQYILATHSEDIFSSVPEDHRVLLEVSRDQDS